jgi:hypothetical protein
VYTYDHRGRGDSGDTAHYTVDREVEDLQAVIAVAGGAAVVHGLSSGAVLTVEATARGVNLSVATYHGDTQAAGRLASNCSDGGEVGIAVLLIKEVAPKLGECGIMA